MFFHYTIRGVGVEANLTQSPRKFFNILSETLEIYQVQVCNEMHNTIALGYAKATASEMSCKSGKPKITLKRNKKSIIEKNLCKNLRVYF